MGYSAEVLADSPSLYLRLGEATGTTAADSSGNGHDGTYTGGYTLGQAGALAGDADTAVSVDGSGSVSVPDASGLTPGGTGLALEAWVNPASFPGAINTLLSKWAGDNNDEYYFYVDGSGVPRVAYHTTGSNTFGTTAYNDYGAATAVPTGSWSHLVVVRDGADLLFYRNGVLDVTRAGVVDGNPIRDGTSPLGIARQGTGSPRYFTGRLDEVAFYAHALSAARVLAHYNAGVNVGKPWVYAAALRNCMGGV